MTKVRLFEEYSRRLSFLIPFVRRRDGGGDASPLKLTTYKRIARKAAVIYKELGALEYRECFGDDMESGPMLPFPKLAKAEPDEIVIFSYVVYESRKHRDAINNKIMADPRMLAMCAETEGVFDCKKMAYGGFKSVVHA